MLRNGPLRSGDIAAEFDVAWPTMTGHLKILKDAGLVTTERTGTSVIYRLNATILEEAAAALLDLGSAIKRKSKR